MSKMKETQIVYNILDDGRISGSLLLALDDREIPVSGYVDEGVYRMNVLAGTTGVAGERSGDWGHGARAALIFLQMEGVGWFVEDSDDHLAIVFGGEFEVHGFAKALRFAADKIEAELALEAAQEPT